MEIFVLRKLNSGQFMNHKVKVLGKGLYKPNIMDMVVSESAQFLSCFYLHLSLNFFAAVEV